MNVLAIIPARGGSKGIPKKNLVPLLGKPLLQWSVEAALNSKLITDVVVSSDDQAILKQAKKNKGVLTIKRPSNLATDSSKVAPSIMHVLKELKTKKYDYIVLLQPTSPLRTAEDIDNAFREFIKKKATSLISVCTFEHHPYKAFKVNKKGYLEGIINNDFPFKSRQELPKVFRANGAIYIIGVDDFMKTGSLLTESSVYFEMTKDKSIDIDTIEDINIIERNAEYY
jgi:N-acylneuraminate cytidylyltransferase